ncbi:hypothetical protein [Methylobacterium sp. 77]|uniref:hypothetical protein n=1 Tax=Methylobacterium sp. 77 TaxID=1101192 RepID=UPI000381CD8A|nr:hypothetical protein [Methylobacterium sp. 77]
MRQLQKDIATNFENARKKVEAYASANEDLPSELRRWMEYATRFIEPDYTIRDFQRAVLERTDVLVGLMAKSPRPSAQSIETAKTHLSTAFDELENAILKHGILTPGGEKVGLGIAGKPI